ncbi:hypothetical protein AXF42_Ash016949 [Apostasia shenzhenica]|uniref:Uncharacterized protein n=1 Tax=Apostasia shenzhenica TaxID=1088818 RepID=A0A2H9ZRK4_9ASPA|nr:hypothetical protein AXF42_Ash016949 [Apostasia shenzhenica]
MTTHIGCFQAFASEFKDLLQVKLNVHHMQVRMNKLLTTKFDHTVHPELKPITT